MTYSTDTRSIQPGQTYVAIVGETYDGHDFVPQALEAGATGLVVSTPPAGPVPEGVTVTVVDDTVAWLVEQASARIEQVGPPIVAITGSVGKTSTKTAIVAVAREAGPVVAAEGNLNTPLGLSLMVLNADITPETTVVMEMGARFIGDIKELTTAFRPRVSVVTNVKGVHLETFGSLDGIEQEKGELVANLHPLGTAVLNADDPRVRRMARRHDGPVLFYGTGDGADLGPDLVPAALPILGDYAVYTALAAFGAGRALGMEDAAIRRGLLKIRPEPGRLAKLRGRGGSTLIDDTYNASPEATESALKVLASLPAERRIACLGDMLELGDAEITHHHRTLETAKAHADLIFAVGPRMQEAHFRISDASQITVYRSSEELAAAITDGSAFTPGPGDAVLVKGSQGLRMERVSEALLHPDLDPAAVLPRQSAAWKAK